MNYKLQKEIIVHVFRKFGLLLDNTGPGAGFIESLLSDKFLTEKKIAFEDEDKKKYQNNVWAGTRKLDKSKIRVLIADIHEDIEEYAIIFQMDNLPAYALRLSIDADDPGSLYVNIKDDKWVTTSIAAQARFLFGIEGLSEMPAAWERLDDYKDQYKLLVQFLNFYERE